MVSNSSVVRIVWLFFALARPPAIESGVRGHPILDEVGQLSGWTRIRLVTKWIVVLPAADTTLDGSRLSMQPLGCSELESQHSCASRRSSRLSRSADE